MSSRAEQKEKRRQEILAAGLDLFIRKGYAGTKISDIANRVGMSTGLLFHYFESKEKLYETLIRFGVTGPQNFMPDPAEDPLLFFERAAFQILEAAKSDPFVAKMFVLMSHALVREDTSPAIKELLDQTDAITPSARLIEAGQRGGSIRPGDPMALSIIFWRTIQGIAEEIAIHPEAPCPEAEWVVDLLRRKNE